MSGQMMVAFKPPFDFNLLSICYMTEAIKLQSGNINNKLISNEKYKLLFHQKAHCLLISKVKDIE